jgi:hypothetical protein
MCGILLQRKVRLRLDEVDHADRIASMTSHCCIETPAATLHPLESHPDLVGLDYQSNADFMAKWGRTTKKVQFTSSNSEMTLTFKHFCAAFGPEGVYWVQRFLRAAFPDWTLPQEFYADLEVRLWPPRLRLKKHRFAPSKARQAQLRRYVIQVGDDAVSHLSGQERGEAVGSLHAKLAASSKIWERDTEPDEVIRLGQHLLVLVEAKRYSPLGTSTRYDSARDQVIRNLDVAFATANRAGIERAAVVVVGPSVSTDCCSWELVDRYEGNPVAIKEALLFRGPREDVSDELVALMARSLSRLTWDELAALSH